MPPALTDPYDVLAAGYDAAWPPTPPELYETLRDAGISSGAHVLDVGIGTGLAAEPLARAGARITGIDPSAAMLAHARRRLPDAHAVAGRAEELPFGARAFDAAICADTFHLVDQPLAFAELSRVVRPGGTVAIWWRTLSTESDVLGHRADAARDAGVGVVPEPLSRGFRAFYAAPLADRTVRTVSSAIRTTVDGWMAFEAARAETHVAYGERTDAWLDALRVRLLRAYGSPGAPVTARTLHYVYLGRF
jgi:SAM-dependent methyltransferase